MERKVVILGGGPNRIGQGIEFDYCCVQAAFALREEGIGTIMVNCNPETVSTDYDTSDRLYFEPLTFEDVLNIVDRERPMGAILQFGGQTPLNLAIPLKNAGVNILGTDPDAIDRAEDRERFRVLLDAVGLRQTPNGTAVSFDEARAIAGRLGYPVLVRPSYVLGGRAMEIVYDDESLREFVAKAADVSPGRPILVDKFLEDAVEVDVDAVCDGRACVVGGVMEHIEEAGIHSGDSAMVLPPYSLPREMVVRITAASKRLAMELDTRGLINIQFAVKDGELYVLEVNPRASRTVPFVSKALGAPLAKHATRIMIGRTLEEIGYTRELAAPHFAVKESVFPFARFPGVDAVLGPEMRSTGEVMGIDASFPMAYAKSQLAAGQNLPLSGNIFVSVKDKDKPAILPIVEGFLRLGFGIVSSGGTGRFLAERGIAVRVIPKVHEGRPNVVDLVRNREIALIVNTPSGKKPMRDIVSIRAIAVNRGVPLVTTIPGAKATLLAVEQLGRTPLGVRSIQEYHRDVAAAPAGS